MLVNNYWFMTLFESWIFGIYLEVEFCNLVLADGHIILELLNIAHFT